MSSSAPLETVLDKGKRIRVVGFDDGPFDRSATRDPHRRRRPRVPLAGVVCSETRFEGLLWGHIRQDGFNATRTVERMVRESKFHAQLHAVLIDGIAFGGFNVVDLPALAESLGLPCIAVMRKPPNLERVRDALQNLTRPQSRWATIRRAGAIHERSPFVFQVAGCSPETAERALRAATDRGHVPEALRLAHLIGAAVATGESSNRA